MVSYYKITIFLKNLLLRVKNKIKIIKIKIFYLAVLFSYLLQLQFHPISVK